MALTVKPSETCCLLFFTCPSGSCFWGRLFPEGLAGPQPASSTTISPQRARIGTRTAKAQTTTAGPGQLPEHRAVPQPAAPPRSPSSRSFELPPSPPGFPTVPAVPISPPVAPGAPPHPCATGRAARPSLSNASTTAALPGGEKPQRQRNERRAGNRRDTAVSRNQLHVIVLASVCVCVCVCPHGESRQAREAT